MRQVQHAEPLELTTGRFVLRSLAGDDIGARWIAWLDDPDILETLNTAPRRHTPASLAEQLRGYDNRNHYQIGIFERRSGTHIGYHELNLNRGHGLIQTNVLIGEKDWWGKGVVLETRAALLDHFFFSDDLQKAIGKPLARNFPMVFNYKVQGWTLEGILRSHLVCRKSGERLDQYEFAMLREEWAKLRRRG